MRLVYTDNGKEVKVGDKVKTLKGDAWVTWFNKPHKASSSGKVCISKIQPVGFVPSVEVYVGCIGAEWIEREDW